MMNMILTYGWMVTSYLILGGGLTVRYQERIYILFDLQSPKSSSYIETHSLHDINKCCIMVT